MNSKHLFHPLLNAVKSYNRVITPLALSLLVLIGCTNEKLQLSAELPQLPVFTVSNSTEGSFNEYPASIQGTVDVEIRPQISGYLEKVYVNEGAYVSKGQILFKINEQPFREQLNNAKANVQAAQAAVLNSQLEIDKLTPLVQNKVVSDIQLQTAKTSYKIAAANLAQAKAGVASAQINMGYTAIKAPVNGYIGRIPKKQGSLVSASDQIALTQLSDIDEVHVYFSLGETDFNLFNEKYKGTTPAQKIKNLPQVALLLSDNSTYKLPGRIDMIDGQFDKNTGSITLRASFPNPNGTLRSGNTGKIRLNIKYNDALIVPQEATMEIQDKVFVFAVDKNNKVSKVPITILGSSNNNYLVKDGLHAGDRIVFKGMEGLKEGDLIKPEPQPLNTATANNNTTKL